MVDEAKMAEWMADPEWGSRNIAMRHLPTTTAIDVDAYGPKEGAAQLADLEARLGPLPATPSSTSRGKGSPSRQHFFTLPEPIVLSGKAAADIDVIQHSHRYSMVAPSINPDADGAPYVWYDADGEPMPDGVVPSIDDFEMLPEAWIEYLRADAIDNAKHATEQWAGDAPDEAGVEERQKIAHIIGTLEGLPDVWAPGADWHNTVFRAACWLSRIANSNAYALTAEAAHAIMLEHTPTYGAEWPAARIEEQWASAVASTEGQFEEPPLTDRPALLMPLDTLNGMSAALYDLANKEPHADNPGARWDLRHRIMQMAFAEGHDEQFAASAAWHAPHAGTDLRNDQFGERALWREVEQAKVKAADDEGTTVEAAPASERPAIGTLSDTMPKLLTVAERGILQGEAGRWWGARYLDWVHTRVPVFNGPYHRMNRWHVLSLVYSPFGFIPKRKGPMGLNLFSMVLGETTTGKSESKDLLEQVIDACFPSDSPNIGGDATANALVTKLIERDGKPSWFNADEAHGLFEEMKSATWRGGLTTKWTDLYEGKVPSILRQGQQDISGLRAKTSFTMHLMGTEAGMTEALDRSMWESGFLARFVWAIGDADRIDPRDLDVDEMEEGAEPDRSYDYFPRQFAAEFTKTIREARLSFGEPVPIRFTPEARARHKQFQDLLPDIYEGHRLEAMLKPTFRRFNDIVRKCAALVALSEGSTRIELEHELIALEQAEEWMTNALAMIEQTTATGFAKQVNSIESFVAGEPGHKVARSKVYRHMASGKNAMKKFDVDNAIMQLVAEGRAEEERTAAGERLVKVKMEGDS